MGTYLRDLDSPFRLTSINIEGLEESDTDEDSEAEEEAGEIEAEEIDSPLDVIRGLMPISRSRDD